MRFSRLLCGGAVLAVLACNRVPRRDGRIELNIGSGAGDAPERIGEVSGLAQDSAGRIWIAEPLASEVRVFGRDGAFLFAFGGRGEAQGQLDTPCCINFDAQGRLWVHDVGNARYTVFAPGASGATPLFSVPSIKVDRTFRAPIRFDAQGQLIDVRPGAATGGGGFLLFRVDTTGATHGFTQIPDAPSDSLGVITLRNRGDLVFIHLPFGPHLLVAYAPDGGFARALSQYYRVAWYDARATFLRRLEESGHGPVLEQDQRTEAARQITADARQSGMDPAELAAVVPLRNQNAGRPLVRPRRPVVGRARRTRGPAPPCRRVRSVG